MLIDLHSHTTISDGTLSPERMVEAAERRGYDVLAITDHVRSADPAYREVVAEVCQEVNRLRSQTSVRLLAGAELTDWEPDAIQQVAEEVRELGAQVVVVHGECVSMNVAPRTNAAAVRCGAVDILGHPGLISVEDAVAAAQNWVLLEISARAGHNWSNGHVYCVAQETGASIVVNSDAHDEDGLLSVRKAHVLIRGAGASDVMAAAALDRASDMMMQKLARRILAL